MGRVLEQIRHLAPTRSTVLIQGEAGTGKSHVARVIHQQSPRRDGPFVEVSPAAVPHDLLATELLGVESPGGQDQPGLLERADSGTLFVKGIDEMPLPAQVHLLQVLADRDVVRQGSTQRRRLDLRVISSARRDLEGEVRDGRFRGDLHQRLSVVVIHLPPLRERLEDIPLLVEFFLRELRRDHHRRVSGLTRGLLERLARHPWPGNVRELRAALEGMVVSARGKRTLDLSDLPLGWKDADGQTKEMRLTVGMSLEEAERRLIEATLKETGFDKPRSAALLGIGLRTLYRKIQRYRIS